MVATTMKRKTARAGIALLAWCVLAPWIAFAESAPVVFGVFPRWNAQITVRNFAPLARQLERELGRPVRIETDKDFDSFMRRVYAREFDIVHLNQLQYIQAHREADYRAIANNPWPGRARTPACSSSSARLTTTARASGASRSACPRQRSPARSRPQGRSGTGIAPHRHAPGGGILIALVILILLSEVAFNRLVVRPIRALGADMACAQSGDLGARARVDREDEIGWLARSFNKMAYDLQDHVNKIEEQRLAHKKMHDYLASILDNTADIIATTALDGSIVEFNAAAERILGYRRDEVVDRASSSLYCDPRERERLYAVVQNGQAVQNAETRLRRKNGDMIDVELTLSPLRDSAGNLIGTVCIGRDITRAKAMRRDLIQAEKMASVGQVSAWIAHQIRNSLGRILMNADALRPGRQTAADAPRAHRDLTAAIGEMDRMVSDLLDYSKTLSLHTTRVDLNAALDDLLGTLPVQVGIFKMEQALGNVLKNALQAMPRGGTLRVETRRGPEARRVTVVIADSGAGIRGEDLPRVFRPFFTTKPGGTGLGLAIAARIAEGAGAAFTFVLPETSAA